MTEAEFRRTNRTHSYLYTDLEKSRAQRASCDFDLSCPKPGEYSEWFAGRLLDRHHQEFVNTSVTTTATSFRAVFDRWGVVIRDRPGVLNGVSVGPGQIVLFPPGVEVQGTYDPGVEYGVISTEERLAALLGRELPHQVVGVRVDPAERARLESSIRACLEGKSTDEDLVANCLGHFDIKAEHLITPARERLACGLRDLIKARLHLPICLADLCREFGVNLRTAERAFQVRFQQTMVSYIKHARLERARALLLAGHSVTRAASDVGWSHLGRFSVEFRQRFGESPSTLRKRSA